MNTSEYTYRRIYLCPNCKHPITFDEAYPVSGKYCPVCDHETNIPFNYWEYGEAQK